MAQRLGALALLFTFAAIGFAEDAPKPDGRPEPSPGPRRGPHGSPELEKTREAFKQMSPEERQQWMDNFRRWQNLSPDEKKSLSDRQESFRRRMREDIENAVKATGLAFDEEQTKQFAQRYTEERHKMEDELRKQMEEIRRPKVKELVEKLKQEFASQAPASAPSEPVPPKVPVVPQEAPK
jgi:hypothetical protein